MSASHGGSRRVLSREGVDRALERLGTEHDSVQAGLLALQDHPGRRLLEGASLSGATAHRWSGAERRIALLWSYFGAYQEALRAARTLRERAGRRPNQNALAELTELLEGDGVTVPGEAAVGAGGAYPEPGALPAGLTSGSAQLSEKLSLTGLTDRMNAWYTEVAAVVSAADTVWSALPSRIDLLVAEVGRVRAQADAVGMLPGRHPVGDGLEQLSTDLEGLRTEVRCDPLAFFVAGAPSHNRAGVTARVSPRPEGHVETSRFDRAARELEDLRREVDSLHRLREESEERLTALGELLRHADTELAEARRIRGEVLARIIASDVPAVPGPPLALYDRLQAAEQYRRGARWDLLGQLLDTLEQDAEDELRRARGALASVRAPLALRDELRGRLDAYKAKAGSRGAIEDPELAEAYQQARRVLWTAPCDLHTAEQAVRRYQELITRLPAPTAPSGDRTPRDGASRGMTP
ncbi:hypothetical protein BIV57_16090 [Mangrovactinospora gilvigrisea]|uniref:Uncharacterized protein n=1 Tax=Mangrovactinospora gilvigrisea TaxID=1428644 RepID=A0A1J7C4J7_9ACTN|nr:hypothetical protein [Mangrovactinospora gilvigrisea]OIV36484.1 hypothetical protein BIV57_16090 [Mangrovactinospora gilvigrisea]